MDKNLPLRCIGLYVDDDAENRHPPAMDRVTWHRAYSFHEAIYMLEHRNYEIVSLDHDIASFYGNREMTGYDVLQYLIMQKQQKHFHSPSVVMVHSANPVGRKKMQEDIDKWF